MNDRRQRKEERQAAGLRRQIEEGPWTVAVVTDDYDRPAALETFEQKAAAVAYHAQVAAQGTAGGHENWAIFPGPARNFRGWSESWAHPEAAELDKERFRVAYEQHRPVAQVALASSVDDELRVASALSLNTVVFGINSL